MQDETLSVASPLVGDLAEYRGDDGSRFKVQILGVEYRRDAWLRPTESLVLLFQWSPASGGTYEFQEAISLASGRIVQQVALCGEPRFSTSGIPSSCYDQRALLLFGGGGLPGALGVAPFWGLGTVKPDRVLAIAPIDGAASSSNFAMKVKRSGDCSALHLSGAFAGQESIRMLPWTMPRGEVTVCPGRSLPTTFTSSLPIPEWFTGTTSRIVSYEITSFTRGEKEILLGAAPEPPGSRELARFNSPYYVEGHITGLPFPPSEAVDVGRSDMEFAALLDNGGMLESYIWSEKGRSNEAVGQREAVTYRAQLTATSPSGSARFLEVEKTLATILGIPQNSTAVVEAKDLPSVTPPKIVTEQLALDLAANLAGGLNGGRVMEKVGFTHNIYANGHAYAGYHPTTRRVVGFDVCAEFSETPPGAETPSGIRTEFSYRSCFDGPKGAILLIDVERSSLPF